MTNKIINEGLDYHDMKGQVEPLVTVDEYAAKMGKDSDVVTITFIVNSKLAAEDLVSWLEIGYDFILDASVSTGEIEPGKYLVFVEMQRRSSVPERIVQILSDMETLTDRPVEKYSIQVDGNLHDATVEALKSSITSTPSEYKKEKEHEDELNEMRGLAGLENKRIYENIDDEIRKYIMNAGL